MNRNLYYPLRIQQHCDININNVCMLVTQRIMTFVILWIFCLCRPLLNFTHRLGVGVVSCGVAHHAVSNQPVARKQVRRSHWREQHLLRLRIEPFDGYVTQNRSHGLLQAFNHLQHFRTHARRVHFSHYMTWRTIILKDGDCNEYALWNLGQSKERKMCLFQTILLF